MITVKDLIKYLGVLSVVVGVIILSIVVFRETQTNTKLLISLILIVIGFFGHIFINKYIN